MQSPLEQKFTAALGNSHYDIVHSKLWDSILFSPIPLRAASTRLFILPISSDKSLSDTNMVLCGSLPQPTAFLIERIIISFSRASTDEDVYSIAESTTFHLWIGQKHFARAVLIHMHQYNVSVAPFRICDFCKSVYVNGPRCPSCGAQQFTLSSLGEEAIAGRQFCMDTSTHPIILPGVHFHVTLDCSHPPLLRAPVKIWVHLEGLEARGVQ